MSTHVSPAHLVEQLERAGVPYQLIDHPRTTTAAAEARVLGVDPHAVAKTVVLETEDGFVRAVLPASARLDLHKVEDALGATGIRLATEEVLAGAYPEFELGVVPPLTGGDGDRVLVDGSLLGNDWIVLEAGTHEQSVRLRAADLVRICDARVHDLSRD